MLEVAVAKLCDIQDLVTIMANELDNLRAAVSRNTSVGGSAIVLLKGLKDKLNEMAQNPGGVDAAAVQELASELDAETDSLAQAITENTPDADPDPVP